MSSLSRATPKICVTNGSLHGDLARKATNFKRPQGLEFCLRADNPNATSSDYCYLIFSICKADYFGNIHFLRKSRIRFAAIALELPRWKQNGLTEKSAEDTTSIC